MLRPYRLLSRQHLELAGLALEVDHVAHPDGKELDLKRLRARDSAYVVVLTESEEIVLVRQWRQAIERFSLEIVAGGVDEGETPPEAAMREVREEVGYEVGRLEELAVIQLSPGLLAARQFYYLAHDCRPLEGDWRAAHPAEPTEPWVVPMAQAFDLAGREIDCAESALALLLAERALRAD